MGFIWVASVGGFANWGCSTLGGFVTAWFGWGGVCGWPGLWRQRRRLWRWLVCAVGGNLRWPLFRKKGYVQTELRARVQRRRCVWRGTVTNSYSGDVGARTLLGTSGMGNITMHGEGHAVYWHFQYLTLSRAKREDDFFLASWLWWSCMCGSFMIESMCMGDYLGLQLFWGVQLASCQLSELSWAKVCVAVALGLQKNLNFKRPSNIFTPYNNPIKMPHYFFTLSPEKPGPALSTTTILLRSFSFLLFGVRTNRERRGI